MRRCARSAEGRTSRSRSTGSSPRLALERGRPSTWSDGTAIETTAGFARSLLRFEQFVRASLPDRLPAQDRGELVGAPSSSQAERRSLLPHLPDGSWPGLGRRKLRTALQFSPSTTSAAILRKPIFP